MADEPADGEKLDGGWQSDVRRRGDIITRAAQPWSPAVIDLLQHLDHSGFDGSPRPVETGFDDHGNEVLSFVPGESVHPHAWTDDGIVALGAMLAGLHRSLADYVPTDGTVWKQWFGRNLGDANRGFGHGDLGPWNIMAVDGQPVGFIDWDTAGPMDPIWELAQVAWLNVQLHDDDVADLASLGSPADRAQQLSLLLDSYGLDAADRVGFVDKMVEVAVHDAAIQAREHQVTPETTAGVAANGYPFAWGIAWRVRGASFMLRHRAMLEAAITARPGD